MPEKKLKAQSRKSTPAQPVKSATEIEFLRSFGRRVASARTLRALTQNDLAAKVGLSRTYIGHIELGVGNPHALTIFSIAEALEVSVSELFLPLKH